MCSKEMDVTKMLAELRAERRNAEQAIVTVGTVDEGVDRSRGPLLKRMLV